MPSSKPSARTRKRHRESRSRAGETRPPGRRHRTRRTLARMFQRTPPRCAATCRYPSDLPFAEAAKPNDPGSVRLWCQLPPDSGAATAAVTTGFLLRPVPRCPRGAGQFEDVHAVVGAVDDVDVAAVVDLDIVGLDHRCAVLLAVLKLDAALVAARRHRRDVGGDLLRAVRVANINRTHASIEMREEHDPLVIDRGHVLV